MRATVDAVLGGLPPRPVMLTVLASGDDVELYVPLGDPVGHMRDVARFGRDVPVAARWRAIVTADETGMAMLEISWRKVEGGAV